jgi:formylglycine-generating enzyme
LKGRLAKAALPRLCHSVLRLGTERHGFRHPAFTTMVNGRFFFALMSLAVGWSWGQPSAAQPAPTSVSWVQVDDFEIARTETTVGQFAAYARPRGVTTQAEREGGGVYENGWVSKPGWNWRSPFGQKAADDEPAVHLTFDEAQGFCRHLGGRLPTDPQWLKAAYTEHRPEPPRGFTTGKSYLYPTGNTPHGAQCLDECGGAATARAVNHGAKLWRGVGHAPVTSTQPGVNGLHDMGGNVWEWVDEPKTSGSVTPANTPRRTRGGSWWYGAAPMQANHLADKPAGTAVVYIGFRCVRPKSP